MSDMNETQSTMTCRKCGSRMYVVAIDRLRCQKCGQLMWCIAGEGAMQFTEPDELEGYVDSGKLIKLLRERIHASASVQSNSAYVIILDYIRRNTIKYNKNAKEIFNSGDDKGTIEGD